MTPTAGPKRHVRARRGDRSAEEAHERALLAEFVLHRDVASLAGAIARRLGGGAREADLIAGAGLEPGQERAEALRSASRFNQEAAFRR